MDARPVASLQRNGATHPIMYGLLIQGIISVEERDRIQRLQGDVPGRDIRNIGTWDDKGDRVQSTGLQRLQEKGLKRFRSPEMGLLLPNPLRRSGNATSTSSLNYRTL